MVPRISDIKETHLFDIYQRFIFFRTVNNLEGRIRELEG